MFKNYLKVAWRNIVKNKGLTFINITGLSIGVAACILIALYIRHETSYDQQIPEADQIYRLVGIRNEDGKIDKGAHFSANMASTLVADIPEVKSAGRIMDNPLFYGAGANDIRIEGQQKQFHEEGFGYADQLILDMFEVPMVFGTRQEALIKPFSLVISESTSKKLFGNIDPVGKNIFLNNNDTVPFTIGGVMQDFPDNSHLDYDYFLTMTDVEFGEGEQTRWLQSNYFVYLQIEPNTNISDLESKVTSHVVAKYLIPAFEAAGLVGGEKIAKQASLDLQPLREIHLHSQDIYDGHTRSDISFVRIFGIVALFILLIACINFVNLSTAKSANRAKEVGLRKVLGSGRRHLVSQFLTESILVTLISFLVGTILAQLMLPLFNQMFESSLSIPYTSPSAIAIVVGVSLLVGLMAGGYPAMYLSKFSPQKVLKGKIRSGSKSSGFRSSLVVFQFAISIILISGTIIINQQFNYILTKKIGFERDQVIQLYSTNLLGDRIQTFKAQLENLPDVASVSISDYLPVEGNSSKRNQNSFYNEGQKNIGERVSAQAWIIDEDYLSTLGIQLVEGRNFSRDRGSESNSVIVNQKMAEQLGIENPIGRKISRYGEAIEIIGVVEDFNFMTMRQEIQPLAFFNGISNSMISIKLKSKNLEAVINNINAKWSEFIPNMDFRYTFLDQSFAQMYAQVNRLKKILTGFAILAIFVACLGLFALSAFMVEQRSKEMSIRKVLGASFQSIFQILTRNFLGLIIISLVIAIPTSVYFMRKWLQDYAYRIDLSWTTYALSALIAILIALITISYHAIRAALVNPMANLKNE